jgi:hypothetical protein
MNKFTYRTIFEMRPIVIAAIAFAAAFASVLGILLIPSIFNDDPAAKCDDPRTVQTVQNLAGEQN